jgi:hypothetical protein
MQRGFCVLTVSCLVSFLGACGPSKPAADASNPPDDTPKWDSSSETAEHPSSSHRAPSTNESGAGGTSDSTAAPPGSSGTGSSDTSPADTAPNPVAPIGAPPPSSGGHLPPDFGGKTYPRDQTEAVLRRAARQVKGNCGAAKDDNGNLAGPWGKATMTVTLGHNGHSRGATIPAPFDGKPTGRCAVQAFRVLTFAPFPGPDADVAWDVDIVKP